MSAAAMRSRLACRGWRGGFSRACDIVRTTSRRLVMMPSCTTANHLREQVRQLVARLEDLIRRQRSAVAHNHENTLAVLDRQIARLTVEKDGAVALLDQHRNEHGCD